MNVSIVGPNKPYVTNEDKTKPVGVCTRVDKAHDFTIRPALWIKI